MGRRGRGRRGSRSSFSRRGSRGSFSRRRSSSLNRRNRRHVRNRSFSGGRYFHRPYFGGGSFVGMGCGLIGCILPIVVVAVFVIMILLFS